MLEINTWINLQVDNCSRRARTFVFPLDMFLLGSFTTPVEFQRMLSVPPEAEQHFARIIEQALGIYFVSIRGYHLNEKRDCLHVVALHPSFAETLAGDLAPKWMLGIGENGGWTFDDKQVANQRRLKALDELAAQAQELNMGY